MAPPVLTRNLMHAKSAETMRTTTMVSWNGRQLLALVAVWCAAAASAAAQKRAGDERSLNELKALGTRNSAYRTRTHLVTPTEVPEPRLDVFRRDIQPVLKRVCVQCHGPDVQEGNIRIDTLNPDLHHGDDVPWWLEVFGALSNGEMPPPDAAELTDEQRSRIIEWLSSEIQTASQVRQAERGHSSFRRMTRYEYNSALQDLLGLPYDFAKDLPPDPNSADGFQNSSETLQMSAVQFAMYRELSRDALQRATVRGEQPQRLYWGVSMQEASAPEWAKQEAQLDEIRETHRDDPDTLTQKLNRQIADSQRPHNRAYYRNLKTGRTAVATWRYPQAKYAWAPTETRPEVPEASDSVAVIPPGQKLIVELGDRIPEEGTLRIRVRAARTSTTDSHIPSLQLEFGWQASNDSHASVRISERDLPVAAAPDQPQFYEWNVPLSEIYPRNLVRNVTQLGDLPNPSEYVRFVNSAVTRGDIQIDYVEITAPVYDQWPPASHTRIFIESDHRADESVYAQEILANFMPRAWRRPIRDSELDQKLELFLQIRPECQGFQEAVLEVLTTVLASPKFLYLTPTHVSSAEDQLSQYELATRLSLFLWSSIPDGELMELAAEGTLSDPAVLANQIQRMLSDARSRRFSEHFVRQWLGLQLLDHLQIDGKQYPQFDAELKEAMRHEPIAFFHEVLLRNESVMDFLHADYAMVNERLAGHYGLTDVFGNHFRRVPLDPEHRRGGLLTQAGLLAMNSDGKDSHPLKRGIWLLENLLNDPPPPPPPAVPRIDLADPEIAKLTLKERMADHRDQAACRSCHLKIDPWGIALENFDAVGGWRTEVNGTAVDATSILYNEQELNGIDGLKRFLLKTRQDQFAGALVHKMTTYALGRPLTFADRGELERITADLRNQGDGLATLVTLIAQSPLFQSP